MRLQKDSSFQDGDQTSSSALNISSFRNLKMCRGEFQNRLGFLFCLRLNHVYNTFAWLFSVVHKVVTPALPPTLKGPLFPNSNSGHPTLSYRLTPVTQVSTTSVSHNVAGCERGILLIRTLISHLILVLFLKSKMTSIQRSSKSPLCLPTQTL